MQSIVEVVCVGSGSNKTYNSVYTDPGFCKMVIVQDDDKFPSPRLCLLRKWPNFEGGFGFKLYEDLMSSTGALKVEEVVRHSPAEAGGLRKNDVIIEINGDNIEYKSFFRLVEILKEACSSNEMELLVLAENDAEWYRVRNITVNSNFPNIEYCETPYYGHILKPLESLSQINMSGTGTNANSTNVPKVGTSQIEFHSSTGKLYRTTLVIDKDKDSIYRRIEELPSTSDQLGSNPVGPVPPLRPDGTYRYPGADNGSVRVYYRRDREFLNPTQVRSTSGGAATATSGEEFNTIADSGHGSLSNRRSTPLSSTTAGGGNLNTTSMSPYSTLGKSVGEQAAVDLLHDKWADLMDKYLDTKFRSNSASGHLSASGGSAAAAAAAAVAAAAAHQAQQDQQDQQNQPPDRDTSSNAGTAKRNTYSIRLSEPNTSVASKRSRCQSPNDGSFSYLYSGRDDFQTASATSFRDLNRQTSPYQHLVQNYQRGSSQTQSHNRYPSPHQSVQSPTRSHRQPSQQRSVGPTQVDSATSASPSPFHHYESSSFTKQSTSTTQHSTHVHRIHTSESCERTSSSHVPIVTPITTTINPTSSSSSASGRAPHTIILRPKNISQSLGFTLDENEIVQKGAYYVKYVDPSSASALAGLKDGDKITKINGKSTAGMGYDEFCNEIAIAQQQQLKNNMIHLMVMRRSAKTSGTGSSTGAVTSSSSHVSAGTAVSSVSNLSGPTILPIKNNNNNNNNNIYSSDVPHQKHKTSSSILTTSTSSNLVDEGYIPGSLTSATSASSSTTTGIGNASTTNILPYNLVSIVRVTSPTNQFEAQQIPVGKAPSPTRLAHTASVSAEVPSYEPAVHYRPTIIYDSHDLHEIQQEKLQQERERERERELRERERRERELQEQRERELKEQRERELKEQRERELKEQRERELRERELREREQREREQREREQREREQREREQRERELREQRERERREQLEREQREREAREREQRERELKEQREKELREQRERELREQRERELREQQQRERELREQRERELREQRERELLERELREQREREQRERELREIQQREREQREQREQREREQRELERQQVEVSPVEAALSAVTTITVIGSEPVTSSKTYQNQITSASAIGSEPISSLRAYPNNVTSLNAIGSEPVTSKTYSTNATTISALGSEPVSKTYYPLSASSQQQQQQQPSQEKQAYRSSAVSSTTTTPYQSSVLRYPRQVNETIITEISTVSEITKHEELIEYRQGPSELNHEFTETDFVSSSTYLPEDEQLTPREESFQRHHHQQHQQQQQQQQDRQHSPQQEDEDESSQLSADTDRARQEFAGNYSKMLVFNAFKQLESSSLLPSSPSSANNKNTNRDQVDNNNLINVELTTSLNKINEQEDKDEDKSSLSSSLQSKYKLSSLAITDDLMHLIDDRHLAREKQNEIKIGSSFAPSASLLPSSSSSSTAAAVVDVENATAAAAAILVASAISGAVSVTNSAAAALPATTTTSHLTSSSAVDDAAIVDAFVEDVEPFDESHFIRKLFMFKKQFDKQQLEIKQPTLAEILKSLNKANVNLDLSSQTEPMLVESQLTSELNASQFTPPHHLGIRLKHKLNPLEIGSHIISFIESDSPAHKAGLRVNSRLIKLNDVTCEDKTHEFVLFYLNYLLRKNSCQTIEMLVYEPINPVVHRPTSSTSVSSSSVTSSRLSSSSSAPYYRVTAPTIPTITPITQKPVQVPAPAPAAASTTTSVGAALAAATAAMSLGSQRDESSSSNNQNLKNILRNVIINPPFKTNEEQHVASFQSDSLESNLSHGSSPFYYSTSRVRDRDPSDSNVTNLKEIFREVIYYKPILNERKPRDAESPKPSVAFRLPTDKYIPIETITTTRYISASEAAQTSPALHSLPFLPTTTTTTRDWSVERESREREERRERELQQQQQQRERELSRERERYVQLERERELRERERLAQLEKERELNREREQREREIREQREREQRERERLILLEREQHERELREQQERERLIKLEREQRERDIKEQLERENQRRAQLEREQRERQELEQREREREQRYQAELNQPVLHSLPFLPKKPYETSSYQSSRSPSSSRAVGAGKGVENLREIIYEASSNKPSFLIPFVQQKPTTQTTSYVPQQAVSQEFHVKPSEYYIEHSRPRQTDSSRVDSASISSVGGISGGDSRVGSAETALAALTATTILGTKSSPSQSASSSPSYSRPTTTYTSDSNEYITLPININQSVADSSVKRDNYDNVDVSINLKNIVRDVLNNNNNKTTTPSYKQASQIDLNVDKVNRYYEFQEKKFNRQQDVMQSLVIAMDNPDLNQNLRTYSLYKSEQFFGYGIAFHTEDIPPSKPSHKLVYPLIEIEPNSPAEEAGMRNGQRVVAVNGEFVNKDLNTLEDVVQAIEDSYYSRNFTEITVLDPQFWDEFMDNPKLASNLAYFNRSPRETAGQVYANQIIEAVIKEKPELDKSERAVPRLCRLSRDSRVDQYGFDFKTLKNEGKHVANNVRVGYPAERAGLRDGDYILEVNGEPISGIEHDAVVNKISAHPTQVDLLVVADLNAYLGSRRSSSRQADEVDIGIDLNQSKSDNISRHQVKLIPGYDGLGISLTSNGVINSVEPNSPADRAGIKKDYKIVEVNGVDVSGRTNREIANLIRENEKNLVVGVLKAGAAPTTSKPASGSPKPYAPVAPVVTDAKTALAQSIEEQAKVPRIQLTESFDDSRQDNVGTRSLSSATGQRISGKTLSGSHTNLTFLKSKFGSCLGLKADEESSNKKNEEQKQKLNLKLDQLPGARVCNLVNRPDYEGFGFSLRGNDKGPHQISNVEADSPASYAGIKPGDYVLKVNDINVAGERYNKTKALIKNECEKGRLKLEVIEPSQCPPDIRMLVLAPPSGYSTLTGGTVTSNKSARKGSIDNLKGITAEILASGRDTVRSSPPDDRRAVSVDGADRRRPYSMGDIDRPNSTVRSYGSTTTAFSEVQPSNLASASTRSVTNLPYTGTNKPKFKRCNVILLNEYPDFGFSLNSKLKPKYVIYSVEENSPAYRANLRATDVIVQIDRKNIRRMKFTKVRQMLSEAKNRGQVEILAIDKDGYTYYKDRKKRFSSNKLVTADNTEPFSTLNNLSSSDAVIREVAVSSDYEGEQSNRSNLQNKVEIGASSPSVSYPVSTTAISSKIQSSPASPSPRIQRDTPKSPSVLTGTDLDNFDIIACTVNRREDLPLGLSLSTAVNRANRSLSRTSVSSQRGVSGGDEDVALPIITSVDPDSIAEQSGLRAGDLILEINGKPTNGQNNTTIGKWIRSSGNTIEFLVSREKTKLNDQFRQEAREIAEDAVRNRLPEYSERPSSSSSLANANANANETNVAAELILSQRLSRRDSAELNGSGNYSQQGSPKIVSSEIRLSSSRLQQQQESPKKERNQSEPAPQSPKQERSSSADVNVIGIASSPISKRSTSSFTLPRDAPIPRLCRVRAYEDQLGFTVAGSKANRGVFKVNDVSPNSPAAHSGLQNDDYIIEISGVNVETMSYADVVDLIKAKKQDDDLQILVADRPTLQWYKAKKIPISSQIVPKMQYIETLLKEELQPDLNDQSSLNSETE